jgi:tetratricopeptide (TPR) repeat protein
MKSPSFRLLILFLPFLAVLTSCQYFTPSFESATALDQAGKHGEAIRAYQTYLQKHPSAPQGSIIYYRIAKNYEAQADYQSSLQAYEKVLVEYPETDEALHALLDIAALYRDKLKNSAKAMEYDQRAFNRYMDNGQLREAVQPLIEAQYQTALASFNQRDYKKAMEIAEQTFQIYPAGLFSKGVHSKIEAFADRARRAGSVSVASVDSVILKDEIPFDKSEESDFTDQKPTGKVSLSPDGNDLITRKKAADGVFYLNIAKAPKKGKKAVFKRLVKTSGAIQPSWSPDGSELIYCRIAKRQRTLEKLNLKTRTIQTLFSTQSQKLGIYPVFNPAGNKIAYIYEGRIGLINTGNKTPYIYNGSAALNNAEGTYFKQLLKTKQTFDAATEVEWSADGTMIRCRQADKQGKIMDELLVLDVVSPLNP